MSNAVTTAPSRRAVAIACRPATPAPRIKHLRRRHGARRGHEHREEARQLQRGDQHRAVAGDRRLRGQRVHRLRTRDPRHLLHRQRRRAGRRDRLEPRRIAQRVQEAQQDRPRPQPGDLRGRGRSDLGHHLGAPRIAHDGTRRRVGLVRRTRGQPRSRARSRPRARPPSGAARRPAPARRAARAPPSLSGPRSSQSGANPNSRIATVGAERPRAGVDRDREMVAQLVLAQRRRGRRDAHVIGAR